MALPNNNCVKCRSLRKEITDPELPDGSFHHPNKNEK
jgi:hypothetical protein